MRPWRVQAAERVEADVLVKIERVEGNDLPLPSYQTQGSAGMDLMAHLPVNVAYTIQPGERCLVLTGLKMAILPGFEGQVRARSGLALKHGVTVLNAPGTIDSDYRGELGVVLINHGCEAFVVRRGDRIAQFVIAPVARVSWMPVDTLDQTARASSGYGSTGR